MLAAPWAVIGVRHREFVGFVNRFKIERSKHTPCAVLGLGHRVEVNTLRSESTYKGTLSVPTTFEFRPRNLSPLRKSKTTAHEFKTNSPLRGPATVNLQRIGTKKPRSFGTGVYFDQ